MSKGSIGVNNLLKGNSKIGFMLLLSLVIVAIASPLYAQNNVPTENEVIEEIVVTGNRYRGLQEVANKRAEDVIFDSLSADDISAVPDFNVADALRRIAGVSAEFDEDEARFVTVRGIDSHLNRVTFDGITLPSTGSFGGTGRNVNIEFLPSTSVKTLQVYKSFRPDMDGSSIGAYINVVSRGAFDADEDHYFIAKYQVSHYAFTDAPLHNALPLKVEITTSKVFGDNGQFGFLLTGLYSIRPRDQDKFNPEGPRTGVVGVPISQNLPTSENNPPPHSWVVGVYANDQRRFGGNGRLEYRNDTTHAFISAYRYTQDESEWRWRNNLTHYDQDDVTVTTPFTGTIKDGRFRVQTSDLPLVMVGEGLSFHMDKSIRERGELLINAGWAKQTFDHNTKDVYFYQDGTHPSDKNNTIHPALAFSYDVSGVIPTRSAVKDPSFIYDPANYGRNDLVRAKFQHTEETVIDFKVDYGENAGKDSFDFGWKAGAEFRRLERMRDNDEYRTDKVAKFEDLVWDKTFQSAFQPEPMVLLNPDAIRAYFATNLGTVIPKHESNSVSADFEYVEDIWSAYGQGMYTTDKYRVVGGLRYENTTFDSEVRNNEQTGEGKFDNLLPSVNLSYKLKEDTRLRVAYSRSLGRPNPSDVTGRFDLNDLTTADGYTPDDEDLYDLVIKRGNPGLEPRISDNYDVSFEQYFNDGEGLFAVAMFHKDIDGDIFLLRTIQPFDDPPAGFESYEGRMARIEQFVNASS
ncbi:MAG: TonB-dependent receptor, partial [Parvibaculales bacterium]